MIRLLAVDIDGTLLDSRGQVPAAHRDALVRASELGVDIALVTGRSFHFTQPILERLPVAVTAIVNNGAVVKTAGGETVLRHTLPKRAARRVLEECRAYEDSVAVVFDRPERQIVFERMDWSHPHRSGYYEKNKAFIASAGVPLVDALIEDPIQVMFNGGVAAMRALTATLIDLAGRVTDDLMDGFTVAVTQYVPRDFSLVDVNGFGCSKGTTLARWTASRGISRGEVMAVGDNLNDVEMLNFAGTAVVMGNATDSLKARGYIVTGTNDEGGLATAIERHILSASQDV